MYNITSDNQVYLIVMGAMEKVFKGVQKEVEELLRENIDLMVYTGENEWYYNNSKKPTYEFKKAFHFDDIKRTAKGLTSLLFYDWENRMESDESTWKHFGVLEENGFNRDTRSEMADAFNISGIVPGNFKSRSREPYWDNFIEQLYGAGIFDDIVSKHMKIEFESLGMKVSQGFRD